MKSKTEFFVRDINDEILKGISEEFGNIDQHLKDFTFFEYDLKDLGLPCAEELLEKNLCIANEVGCIGWRSNAKESDHYKGFSLTYNPDFIHGDESIYHQTFGSSKLTQSYSRIINEGNHTQTKNTYYDTYAFRQLPPAVKKHLGSFFDLFSLSLLRSRTAFFETNESDQQINTWHKDEFPYQLLRINIPLQTSEEHVIDIAGKDEFGNSLSLYNKHLEIGKLYIWNTRISHRIRTTVKKKNMLPRIHMVLGFSPYFSYNEENDSFTKNHLHGMPIKEIVEKRLFLRTL